LVSTITLFSNPDFIVSVLFLEIVFKNCSLIDEGIIELDCRLPA